MGCQQRLEVIKEDKLAVNEDEENATHASGMVEESVVEDVQVKDFLPELKHICDKLEEADNNAGLILSSAYLPRFPYNTIKLILLYNLLSS